MLSTRRALLLLVFLVLANCGDSNNKNPLSSGDRASPDDKVLRGDYSIDSQATINDLTAEGGESFLITGNLTIRIRI